MQLYCEICKEDTRHKWDDYSNRFECIRKTEAHGWYKKNKTVIDDGIKLKGIANGMV